MILKKLNKTLYFIIKNKKFFLILNDLFFCVFSIWLSMYIRLDHLFPLFDLPFILILFASLSLISIFFVFDVYKTMNRFSGWESFIQLAKALFVNACVFFIFITMISFPDIPRSIGLLHPIIITLLIIFSRVSIRVLLNKREKNLSSENVLIYGAGEAGRQLASTITFSKKMKLLGFLDDRSDLIGNKINNKSIYNPKELKNIRTKLKIDTVLFAIPSIDNKRKSDIIMNIQQNDITVRTLPTLSELETNKVSTSDLRAINVNDLLGRASVNVNNKVNSEYLVNQIVLITGGGGSIGSELCKQVLEQNPKKIIIVDSNEYALYRIVKKLNDSFQKKSSIIIPLLASIQDSKALEHIFIKYKPQIIYHAAAYKHVPLVQGNPFEGIKNNVIGTLICLDLAIKYNSKKFVLISSDKAVRPTNIMGASKRFAELILQAYSENSKNTILTIVRFGNVLASSGSVVPLFNHQIKKGGPVTVTHKNVTRFFMTAAEAIHLIIESGGMSKGGEVFILKMGSSVKIFELAKTMILLSGKTIKDQKNVNGDIEIKITGLRPGEKLYEEVLIGNNPIETDNNMILKANENFLKKQDLQLKVSQLKKYLEEYNLEKINNLFFEIISGYKIKSSKVK
jgi:FlaA1/EpsC-like NDP-sugar epimerase